MESGQNNPGKRHVQKEASASRSDNFSQPSSVSESLCSLSMKKTSSAYLRNKRCILPKEQNRVYDENLTVLPFQGMKDHSDPSIDVIS